MKVALLVRRSTMCGDWPLTGLQYRRKAGLIPLTVESPRHGVGVGSTWRSRFPGYWQGILKRAVTTTATRSGRKADKRGRHLWGQKF